jgi:hypothetical protein
MRRKVRKPTPEEVNRTIVKLARPSEESDPYKPLWWVQAYDPEGNECGFGTDDTLRAAAAAAWILSHQAAVELAPLFGTDELDVRALDCVPRTVPPGWRFEVAESLLRVSTGVGSPPVH